MKPWVALLLLTSCASTDPAKAFRRGASTQDQFERDAAFCEMEAEKVRPPDSWGPGYYSAKVEAVLDACMRSKGYKR